MNQYLRLLTWAESRSKSELTTLLLWYVVYSTPILTLAWPVMLGLGGLHRVAHAIPALSFYVVYLTLLVVLTVLVIGKLLWQEYRD
jgi:hypothetical protein